MLFKWIYKAGVYFRNDKIFRNFRSLKETDFLSLEKLEAIQLQKLQTLIATAYQQSNYYRNKFDQCGVLPSEIKSLQDITKLPTTEKGDLLGNRDDIQLPIIGEKSVYSETSGSSGEPLVFYRNQDWDAWHNASVFRGYSWHGIEPYQRNGYLWGYNLSKKEARKTKWLDRLQNRFRLFSYSDDEIAKFCKKLKKSRYLHGYSSMIYEIAKYLNSHEALKKSIKLDFIKGTSEKIYDSYQEETKKAFGKKIISEYGAAEAGIIAFECPHGNMHVNMETVVVEEVDHHILVTNLASKSFPIIRYQLGDYIILDKETRCPCGRQSHIIQEVTGRVGKQIFGIENTYPSLTLYYIFKNIAIKHGLAFNYQFIQEEKGVLQLNVEQNLSDNDFSIIREEIVKYFGDDINCTISDGKNLITRDGKTKDFISLLD